MKPNNRKDIFGDLGIVIGIFEIWRSIALLDYKFLKENAVEFDKVLMISLDKLLLMRVCAMKVDKYKKDLEMIKNYYYQNYRNSEYLSNAQKHIVSYQKNNGVIIAGNYDDEHEDTEI